MARPTISEDQRKREAAAVKRHYECAKSLDPTLTQEQLASEMDVSQGLIGQWFSGKTPIPDKRMIWLAKRLLTAYSPPWPASARTASQRTAQVCG